MSVNRKEDIDETISELTSKNKKPNDLDECIAEGIGKEALQTVGYEKIMAMALEAGLVQNNGNNRSSKDIQGKFQNSETRIFRQAVADPTFWGTFAPYAVSAGVASQVDSPAPGPGDLVALGILAVGLVAAGYTIIKMASHGNQADTGIMGEVRELIEAGIATTVCAALERLMQVAEQARDTRRIQRIKKTQIAVKRDYRV